MRKVIPVGSDPNEMRDKLVKMGCWSADCSRVSVHYAFNKSEMPVGLASEKYLNYFRPTHRELTLADTALPVVDLKLAA